ncbi:hypothetical protein NKDENANG_00765 [Candidatus Entotheonellaceae bacterium PAL068K]
MDICWVQPVRKQEALVALDNVLELALDDELARLAALAELEAYAARGVEVSHRRTRFVQLGNLSQGCSKSCKPNAAKRDVKGHLSDV